MVILKQECSDSGWNKVYGVYVFPHEIQEAASSYGDFHEPWVHTYATNRSQGGVRFSVWIDLVQTSIWCKRMRPDFDGMAREKHDREPCITERGGAARAGDAG